MPVLCPARYDGLPLWNVRGQPFVHEFVWILNFISFFFLYPSTFNLLEVCPSTCCHSVASNCMLCNCLQSLVWLRVSSVLGGCCLSATLSLQVFLRWGSQY